jgi:Tol biopolymer transport system component
MWSPDSARLGFLTGSFANNLWLNVIDADGSRQQVLDSTGWVDHFVWLPDSQHVLYRTGSEVISIRVDRQEKQTIRSVLSSGSISPDAAWIATLVDTPPGYHQELVLQALDGSPSRQLTRNPGNQLCLKMPF